MTILGFKFGGDILKWERNQAGMRPHDRACLPDPRKDGGAKFLSFPDDDFACLPAKRGAAGANPQQAARILSKVR
jgi:hypothetical protein